MSSPGSVRSVRVRAGALFLVTALLAASSMLVYRAACDPRFSPEPSEIATPVPFDVDVRSIVPATAERKVERHLRTRVRPPAPPAEGADAEALWSFGEEHLGWTPRANVDLSQHESDQLRAWIQQDLRIYELSDGLYEDLGLGHAE